jgi:hypothetical protein
MDTSFYYSKYRWLAKPYRCLSGMRFFVLPVLLGCLVLPVAAAPARNERNDLTNPAGSSSFAPAPSISLEKATSIARRHTGGRVLSTTPKQRSAGTEYRVRMLVDGERVVTVTVDHKGRIKNKR